MKRNMRGYSVVEFLVSISVALVLTATSLPMVRTTMNTYTLRNDARRIAAQCHNARFQAIAGNTPYRLHVSGASIELQKFSGGSYTVVSSFPLSAGVDVATPWSADPVFSPRGTVSPSASIILANHWGNRNTVSVSVLGMVTLQ